MSRRGTYSFIPKCAYLTFVIVAIVVAQEECDITKCAGPLKYYKLLGCEPVYENGDDCCAIKYDCDHLKERSKKNCYVNYGKKYELGEQLKEEDRNPCDSGCFCSDANGAASFVCPIVDCFHGSFESATNGSKYCYMQRSPTQCCPGPLVCPEKQEDIATCVVDGKTYKDGEHFTIESDPELNCFCGPDYKGENISPFCLKSNRTYCDPFFNNAENVQNQCAPVYNIGQSPQTSCHSSFRCHYDDDYVVHTHESHEEVDEVNVCMVGNLTMHLGDELNEKSKHYPTCTKCVCETPPIPTCVYLPSNKCDEQ